MATIKYKDGNQWKELDRIVLDGVGPQVVGNTGNSETSVMSQKAVTNLMQQKLVAGDNITINGNIISAATGGGGGGVVVEQVTGTSTTAVMSQNAVSTLMQKKLVSGTDIKTLSGQTLLGSGNIEMKTVGGMSIFGTGDIPVGGGGGVDVVQSTGTSTSSVMSQNAVSTLMQKKLTPGSNITIDDDGTISATGGGGGGDVDIRQTTGTSTTAVMSQKAVTDALSGKANTATTLAGYGITNAYTKSETSGASEISTALNGKQATLVSGTNIKTINGYSLLGSGNIDVSGGGGGGDYLPLSGGLMTGSPYISMPASAASIGNDQPLAITYGRIQCYGTLSIAADTDGSQDEYIILTSGYGTGSSTSSNGLAIGYNSLTWKDNPLIHSGNISNYAVTSLNGYATESWVSNNFSQTGHTHSYLPLSGGTLTGDLSINGYLKIYDKYNDSSLGYGLISLDSDGINILANNSSGKQIYLGSNTFVSGTLETDSKFYCQGTASFFDKVTVTSALTANSFVKSGSSDDYVLLGGGGTKALSEITGGTSGDYLPLSGGTLTGALTLNSSLTANGTSFFDVGLSSDGDITTTCEFKGGGFVYTGLPSATADNYVLLAGGGYKALSDFAVGSFLPLSGGTVNGTTYFYGKTTIVGNGEDIVLNTNTGSQSSHGKLQIGTYVSLSNIPTSMSSVLSGEMWIDDYGIVRKKIATSYDPFPKIYIFTSSGTLPSNAPVGTICFAKSMITGGLEISIDPPSGESIMLSDDQRSVTTGVGCGLQSMMFVKMRSTQWCTFYCG